MDRVLAAARLHFARPAVVLGIPWLIVLSSFLLNAVLWGVTPIAESGDAQTGGLAALYVTVIVVYVQAVTQLLPFGMGMGLSRRSFYLGTAVAALVQAICYGLVLTALGLVERATGGFGLGAAFWRPSPIAVDSPVLQFVVYTVPLLACAAVGAALGVLYKRWGPPALYALALAGAAAVVGTLALIGSLDAWDQVFAWFAARSQLTYTIGFPLALTVAAGALGLLGLRRVVP